MRQSGLKSALKENRVTIGSWITLAEPAIAEIMAKAGFDWLTVDMEHSAITLSEAQGLIRVIELSGCVPLVRVGDNDPNIIKRVMDAGAHGVIIPMINCREDAEKGVAAVRYPPAGSRGVGLARAQGYGTAFAEYKAWLVSGSVVIVQIEHIKAVENINDILLVEGVDGLIIGPYDLSASLGVAGELDNGKVAAAMSRVLEAARTLNVPAGVHVIPPDPNEVKNRLDDGYKLIGFSLDTLFLSRCGDLLKAAREPALSAKGDA